MPCDWADICNNASDCEKAELEAFIEKWGEWVGQ